MKFPQILAKINLSQAKIYHLFYFVFLLVTFLKITLPYSQTPYSTTF